MDKKRKGFSMIEIIIYLIISSLFLSGGTIVSRQIVANTRLKATETILDSVCFNIKDLFMMSGSLYIQPLESDTNKENSILNYLKEAEKYSLSFQFDYESLVLTDDGVYIDTKDIKDSFNSNIKIYFNTSQVSDRYALVISSGNDATFDICDYVNNSVLNDIVKKIEDTKLILD